jgi:hypothetical protein
MELTTEEMWFLSQILVCGEITVSEFMQMNAAMGTVKKDILISLTRKGAIDYTQLQYDTIG